MNPFMQSCLPDQKLSKSTLLAMLDSDIDTSKVVSTSSGAIIDISNMQPSEIRPNLNSGLWVYYENRMPRRMLASNNNWQIVSFNPSSRLVCVKIFAPSGMRMLNFTLPELSIKF